MRRSSLLRAGRLGALRRSTFNCWRSATTSASSEVVDRKGSRTIHLRRFKSSHTQRSSPDSDLQAKRTGFATGTAVEHRDPLSKRRIGAEQLLEQRRDRVLSVEFAPHVSFGLVARDVYLGVELRD